MCEMNDLSWARVDLSPAGESSEGRPISAGTAEAGAAGAAVGAEDAGAAGAAVGAGVAGAAGAAFSAGKADAAGAVAGAGVAGAAGAAAGAGVAAGLAASPAGVAAGVAGLAGAAALPAGAAAAALISSVYLAVVASAALLESSFFSSAVATLSFLAWSLSVLTAVASTFFSSATFLRPSAFAVVASSRAFNAVLSLELATSLCSLVSGTSMIGAFLASNGSAILLAFRMASLTSASFLKIDLVGSGLESMVSSSGEPRGALDL